MYPFDYNKNDPMQGFDAWREYLRREVVKLGNSGSALKHYNHALVKRIREIRCQNK